MGGLFQRRLDPKEPSHRIQVRRRLEHNRAGVWQESPLEETEETDGFLGLWFRQRTGASKDGIAPGSLAARTTGHLPTAGGTGIEDDLRAFGVVVAPPGGTGAGIGLANEAGLFHRPKSASKGET